MLTQKQCGFNYRGLLRNVQSNSFPTHTTSRHRWLDIVHRWRNKQYIINRKVRTSNNNQSRRRAISTCTHRDMFHHCCDDAQTLQRPKPRQVACMGRHHCHPIHLRPTDLLFDFCLRSQPPFQPSYRIRRDTRVHGSPRGNGGRYRLPGGRLEG